MQKQNNLIKQKAYSLDKYDLNDIFRNFYNDSPEDRLRALRDKNIKRYRTRLIVAGKNIEYEIYPVFNKRPPIRADKHRKSSSAQTKLNYKNSIKNLTRLINANFTDEDTWGTNTYSDEERPLTEAEANDRFAKFIRIVRRDAKRRGYPPLKYIYVTQFGDDVRIHHHYVVNFPDRDRLEELWFSTSRKQTRRLQSDECGYEGWAHYVMLDAKCKKRFKTSRNLIKPDIHTSDTRISRQRGKKIATGEIDDKSFFESLAPGWRFIDKQVKYSDFVAGAYIYVRMRLRN